MICNLHNKNIEYFAIGSEVKLANEETFKCHICVTSNCNNLTEQLVSVSKASIYASDELQFQKSRITESFNKVIKAHHESLSSMNTQINNLMKEMTKKLIVIKHLNYKLMDEWISKNKAQVEEYFFNKNNQLKTLQELSNLIIKCNDQQRIISYYNQYLHQVKKIDSIRFLSYSKENIDFFESYFKHIKREFLEKFDRVFKYQVDQFFSSKSQLNILQEMENISTLFLQQEVNYHQHIISTLTEQQSTVANKNINTPTNNNSSINNINESNNIQNKAIPNISSINHQVNTASESGIHSKSQLDDAKTKQFENDFNMKNQNNNHQNQHETIEKNRCSSQIIDQFKKLNEQAQNAIKHHNQFTTNFDQQNTISNQNNQSRFAINQQPQHVDYQQNKRVDQYQNNTMMRDEHITNAISNQLRENQLNVQANQQSNKLIKPPQQNSFNVNSQNVNDVNQQHHESFAYKQFGFEEINRPQVNNNQVSNLHLQIQDQQRNQQGLHQLITNPTSEQRIEQKNPFINNSTINTFIRQNNQIKEPSYNNDVIQTEINVSHPNHHYQINNENQQTFIENNYEQELLFQNLNSYQDEQIEMILNRVQEEIFFDGFKDIEPNQSYQLLLNDMDKKINSAEAEIHQNNNEQQEKCSNNNINEIIVESILQQFNSEFNTNQEKTKPNLEVNNNKEAIPIGQEIVQINKQIQGNAQNNKEVDKIILTDKDAIKESIQPEQSNIEIEQVLQDFNSNNSKNKQDDKQTEILQEQLQVPMLEQQSQNQGNHEQIQEINKSQSSSELLNNDDMFFEQPNKQNLLEQEEVCEEKEKSQEQMNHHSSVVDKIQQREHISELINTDQEEDVMVNEDEDKDKDQNKEVDIHNNNHNNNEDDIFFNSLYPQEQKLRQKSKSKSRSKEPIQFEKEYKLTSLQNQTNEISNIDDNEELLFTYNKTNEISSIDENEELLFDYKKTNRNDTNVKKKITSKESSTQSEKKLNYNQQNEETQSIIKAKDDRSHFKQIITKEKSIQQEIIEINDDSSELEQQINLLQPFSEQKKIIKADTKQRFTIKKEPYLKVEHEQQNTIQRHLFQEKQKEPSNHSSLCNQSFEDKEEQKQSNFTDKRLPLKKKLVITKKVLVMNNENNKVYVPKQKHTKLNIVKVERVKNKLKEERVNSTDSELTFKNNPKNTNDINWCSDSLFNEKESKIVFGKKFVDSN